MLIGAGKIGALARHRNRTCCHGRHPRHDRARHHGAGRSRSAGRSNSCKRKRGQSRRCQPDGLADTRNDDRWLRRRTIYLRKRCASHKERHPRSHRERRQLGGKTVQVTDLLRRACHSLVRRWTKRRDGRFHTLQDSRSAGRNQKSERDIEQCSRARSSGSE